MAGGASLGGLVSDRASAGAGPVHLNLAFEEPLLGQPTELPRTEGEVPQPRRAPGPVDLGPAARCGAAG